MPILRPRIWLVEHHLCPLSQQHPRSTLVPPSRHDLVQQLTAQTVRHASTSSSTRWKTRQAGDPFARSAKVSALKSRAAYKLLDLDGKHRLFARGQTVIDLGYAPGSWSQVAVSKTAPGGRVVGIDVIPAQPPRGASSIQGNFLSEEVRDEVRSYVREWGRGRVRVRGMMGRREDGGAEDGDGADEGGVAEGELEEMGRGIVQGLGTENGQGHQQEEARKQRLDDGRDKPLSRIERDERDGRVVDVVLSDMSAPWDQTSGMWIRSVSNPYYRMMNTSGMPFRDHAGSMDLCTAALTFCFDTLRTGGHFLCKFYQGGEDKAFETKLKKLFEKVHREKPESSRSESKEAYFVALRRKSDIARADVFPDDAT